MNNIHGLDTNIQTRVLNRMLRCMHEYSPKGLAGELVSAAKDVYPEILKDGVRNMSRTLIARQEMACILMEIAETLRNNRPDSLDQLASAFLEDVKSKNESMRDPESGMVPRNRIKSWVDANMWDGEDRSGCKGDGVGLNPDDLQEFCEELVEAVVEPPKVKPLDWAKVEGYLGGIMVNTLSNLAPMCITQHENKGSKIWLRDYNGVLTEHHSIDAAKQAAQEQYEKMVLECLE